MTDSDLRRRLRAYAHAWATNDRPAFLELFAADAVVRDPAHVEARVGLEAIAELWDAVSGRGMELTPTVHRAVVCGSQGVLDFTMRTAAPGFAMDIDIVDVFTFDAEGRIVELRAFWDRTTTRQVTAPG